MLPKGGEGEPDVHELADWLVRRLFFVIDKLLVEQDGRVRLVFKTAVNDARPVVRDKTEAIIVVDHPFILWCGLGFPDHLSLPLQVFVIKTIQVASLEEYFTEEGEVVIVTETDHAAENILLVISSVEHVRYIHQFRNGN